MTPAQIAEKIAAGYGIAASKVGGTCNWYRPAVATAVVASGNLLGTLPAAFAPNLKFSSPQVYGKPTWLALVDGTRIEVGDYLVDPNNVAWFIAALQTLLPPLAVQCTRVINLTRAAAPTGVGVQSYGGDVESTETALLTGWPASVLASTKRGITSDVKLPGDVNFPFWTVLLPAFEGVTLRTDDIITDDLSRRAVIVNAELTPLGWRIEASERST